MMFSTVLMPQSVRPYRALSFKTHSTVFVIFVTQSPIVDITKGELDELARTNLRRALQFADVAF